jgi:CNT family concentrative nucleoside transporter
MMVIYAAILGPVIPDALGHILIASIISTPAALAVAALMVPFTPDPEETGELSLTDPPASTMEAIVRGTIDGIGIVATIIAMLIVLVALVTLVNMALGAIPFGAQPITLQQIFAYIFWPLLWLVGIPVEELGAASLLMGTKTVLNEFVAYLDLARLPPETLSERSRLMMTYALCGFANFGSLGILVGGMTAMAPERRHDIISLGPRSIVSGTLATMMSAAVVGVIA